MERTKLSRDHIKPIVVIQWKQRARKQIVLQRISIMEGDPEKLGTLASERFCPTIPKNFGGPREAFCSAEYS